MQIIIFIALAICVLLLIAVVVMALKNMGKSSDIKKLCDDIDACKAEKERIENDAKTIEEVQANSRKNQKQNSEVTPEVLDFAFNVDGAEQQYHNIIDVLLDALKGSGVKKSYKEKASTLLCSLGYQEATSEDTTITFNNVDEVSTIMSKLSIKMPQLTKNELRLSAYIYLDKTTKEIASETEREIRSVESARNRLRKSLGCESGQDIKSFIASVLES